GHLAEIIAGTSLLICNDSALAHIGSAVGTPVIAIFGPTHPTLGFWPRGLRDCILQVDEPCRPCSLHGKRSCYRDRQYCFERISVNDVLEKAMNVIKSNAGGEKALFVDRDGTLIKEKGYLRDPNEVEPEFKAVEAIKMAREAGYRIIGLTNQSGVARGYYDEDTVHRVNQRVLDIFSLKGAPVDEILYCPHYIKGELPQYAIECICRKPATGMLELASLRHNINPFNSFVIGDKLTDVQLAAVSGGRGILVRTGFGKQEEKLLQTPYVLAPEIITENFHEAVKYVVGGGGNSGDDS
ncbi:MAG: HAD-IIIA family hydrolase, partial [Candidatus Zixiibacteriota bacterium]